jgi:hypothetical protein
MVALVKPGRRRLAKPVEELVEPEVVDPPSNRRGDAIEHKRLEFLPLVRLWNNNQVSHLSPIMGNIGSHVNINLGRRRPQPKRSLRRAVVAAQPDHGT